MKNGKIRIYDLSKELVLDNKDVLEICSKLSIEVKNHSSTITESQAENIKEAAKTYHMTSANNQVKKNTTNHHKESKNTPTSDLKPKNKKQEILAIYANSDQESPVTDNSKDSPVLLTPPRPQMSSSETDQSITTKPKESVVTPDLSLKAQPPRPQVSPNKPVNKPIIPITLSNKSELPNKSSDHELAQVSGDQETTPKPKINKIKTGTPPRRSKNNQRRRESIEVLEIDPSDKDAAVKPIKKSPNLKEEGSFDTGEKTGFWKKYYPDGSLEYTGNYLKSKKILDWKYFYPNDNLEAKELYDRNGVLIQRTTYYPNGSLWCIIKSSEQATCN